MNKQNIMQTKQVSSFIGALLLASATFCSGQQPTLSPAPSPGVVPQPPAALATQPSPLAWDADSKTFEAKPGELTARFTFFVTNISSQPVVITALQRSCGCTEATMPAQPWNLVPGTNGPIQATIDLHGKAGRISKPLTVQSSCGAKVLMLNVVIPAPPSQAPEPPAAPVSGPKPSPSIPTNVPAMDRKANLQTAALDRQAVFKGDCARCHFEPTLGKMGVQLYQSGCGICHDAENRAATVPDLHNLKHPMTAALWQEWITDSKPGSLMPAFATAQGGPLTEAQIMSLVDYLSHTISSGS
jgi:mono/diheme cytochrome c family protein